MNVYQAPDFGTTLKTKIHIDFKDMITNDLVIRVSKTLLNCSIISSSNM